MNTFKGLFSSVEWVNLKTDTMQLLRTLSTWLESFPKKETSILLVILAGWICFCAARIIVSNLRHPSFFFSLETLLVGATFVLMAYLGVNRFRYLRNTFYKKSITP